MSPYRCCRSVGDGIRPSLYDPYLDVADEVRYLTVCLLLVATLRISLVDEIVMDGDFPSVLLVGCIS
jgi:hypothetical protein